MEVLPANKFHRNRQGKPIPRCKKCVAIRVGERRSSAPDYIDRCRRKYLLKRFGLTPETYEEMHAEQGCLCAICRMPETRFDPRTKKPHHLAVDHHHGSNRVRGLLCQSCNLMLGKAKDDAVILRAAVEYLETR